MKKKTNNPQFDEVFYFEVGVLGHESHVKTLHPKLRQKVWLSGLSHSLAPGSSWRDSPLPAGLNSWSFPLLPGKKGRLLLSE